MDQREEIFGIYFNGDKLLFLLFGTFVFLAYDFISDGGMKNLLAGKLFYLIILTLMISIIMNIRRKFNERRNNKDIRTFLTNKNIK